MKYIYGRLLQHRFVKSGMHSSCMHVLWLESVTLGPWRLAATPTGAGDTSVRTLKRNNIFVNI